MLSSFHIKIYFIYLKYSLCILAREKKKSPTITQISLNGKIINITHDFIENNFYKSIPTEISNSMERNLYAVNIVYFVGSTLFYCIYSMFTHSNGFVNIKCTPYLARCVFDREL